MEPSRTDLAITVDVLSAAGRVTVSETRTQLALYQLDGAAAGDVVARLAPAGFTLRRLADEGGDLRIDQLDDEGVGIELICDKPVVREGIFPVLTSSGFDAVLARPPYEPVIWLQGLDRTVYAKSVCFAPWGDEQAFVPEVPLGDPTRVVRVIGNAEPPIPIDRWVLRDPDSDLSGRLLLRWRASASAALTKALAQEVERDGKLLFRGPPPARFRATGAERIDVSSFSGLQRAAGWVYENPRELENRHSLMAAEVARTALRDGDLIDLAAVMTNALEGARIAYEFGVSQQSRDALKSLSDLRKAVSDETAKLSDATRSLAAAVMTSAVGNAGLIIARLTLSEKSRLVAPAAGIIGAALAAYVGVVIWSGWHFLTIQQDLRRDWRDRLYRFLGDTEYERMVTTPVGKAETGFKKAAMVSGGIAALMLAAVLIVILWST